MHQDGLPGSSGVGAEGGHDPSAPGASECPSKAHRAALRSCTRPPPPRTPPTASRILVDLLAAFLGPPPNVGGQNGGQAAGHPGFLGAGRPGQRD